MVFQAIFVLRYGPDLPTQQKHVARGEELGIPYTISSKLKNMKPKCSQQQKTKHARSSQTTYMHVHHKPHNTYRIFVTVINLPSRPLLKPSN